MTDINVEFTAKVTMFDVFDLGSLEEAKKCMENAIVAALGELFDVITVDAESVNVEYVEHGRRTV